jgi:hypothetical protein
MPKNVQEGKGNSPKHTSLNRSRSEGSPHAKKSPPCARKQKKSHDSSRDSPVNEAAEGELNKSLPSQLVDACDTACGDNVPVRTISMGDLKREDQRN